MLALPFVLFSTCGGPEAEYTGYEALRGIPFSATEWGLSPGQFSGFGPDWWVAGIMVIALLAIGAAVWGGVRGAFAGIALAVAGTICVVEAVSFFQPLPGAYQWSPETAAGGSYILLIYVVRSWSTWVGCRGRAGLWFGEDAESNFRIAANGLRLESSRPGFSC